MRAAVYSMGRRISGDAITLAPRADDMPASLPPLRIVVPPLAGQRAAMTELDWLAQRQRGVDASAIAAGAGCSAAEVQRVIGELIACGVRA